MARANAPRSVPLGARFLAKRASELRRAVEVHRAASAVEIASVMPGGDSNPDRTTNGWLYAIEQLTRMHERSVIRSGISARVDATDTTTNGTDATRAAASAMLSLDDDAMIAAMQGTPRRVRLVRALPVSGRDELFIQPKSLQALKEITCWEHDLRWLLHRLGVLRAMIEHAGDKATASDLDMVKACERREIFLHAMIVWIGTTGREIDGKHYHGACPYDPAMEINPTPPADLLELDTFDLPRLHAACVHVNGARLEQFRRYLPVDRTPDDKLPPFPTWAPLIASASKGEPVDDAVLIGGWGLERIVAKAAVNAASYLREKERAEQERRAKGDAP